MERPRAEGVEGSPGSADAWSRWRSTVELLALTVVVFVGYALARPDRSTRIVVTDQVADDVVALQTDVLGRVLTDDEVEASILSYLDDEVLVREAFRQGVDRGDPRVRSALLGAAERAVAARGGEDTAGPAPGELEAFFQRDPERYQRSETVALEVLTIPVGILSEDESARILAGLRAGTAPASLAGPGAQFSTFRTITASMLSRAYGRAVGGPVFEAEIGAWQGPLASLQGVDFVRVVDRQTPPSRDFEEVARLVEEDWRRWRFLAALEQALERVRPRYRVELPEGVHE